MKQFIIRGKRWKIKQAAPSKSWCWNPKIKREIHMPTHGDTLDDLQVILHEVLHASSWDLSEEAVDAASAAQARILWKLGWRKEE